MNLISTVDIAGIALLEEVSALILNIKQKNMSSFASEIFIFYYGNHKKKGKKKGRLSQE